MLTNASSTTLIVPDDFDSIQDAINNASQGAIIYVRSGTYPENILINKSITLIGENRENTIIDGGGVGNVISIQASNVNISGFTIRNSDPHVGCGIYADRVRNIVISNNKVESNNIGIQITFSSQNQICGNTISKNYFGIQLIYSSGNTICRNDFKDNSDGIDIYYYSFNNTIYENTFSSNDWGIYIWNSDNNVFYHNNFINNNYNVYAEQTTNTWSVDGEGNYWDDYNGKDLNKDGIGDLPYNIAEGNIDYYPLMGMFHKFIALFSGNINYVVIISNSTILDFTFKMMAETKARVILFNASGDGGSASFSRVVIPKALMKSIHAVLVNEEEVNVTLLNVEDMEHFYLYIEHSSGCSIKIVYSELLDWYYQLLEKYHVLNESYSELLNRYRSLNESYSVLLDGYSQLLSDYSELLSKYHVLNESYSELLELSASFQEFNATINALIEKLNTLNATLDNILRDYSELQNEFNVMDSLYQAQTQNFRGLMYIFAATTAIFILTTIYFSKKAHEKVSESKKHAS
ncbi:MAG: NosD domain-containing protein [Candidatus Bathyarchaeia archaeon]